MLILLLLFLYRVSSQSCDDYDDEFKCVDETAGACKWLNYKCRCASDVKLDILFGVDTSGSIGFNGFQIQKQFISNLVVQGVNNGSRIGFTMFNTDVNASRGIQEWDTDILEDYVDHIYWTAGWTNTKGLITSALTEFENTKDDSRQQILMLVTDGNPCLPASRGGCPHEVCSYAAQVKSAGIRTIIIGVGDGLNPAFVGCLAQSTDDYIPVASFSTEDFNSIMGSLSDILCPISKECKVTEVKAQKKGNAYNNRWGRFIEIYNTGIDFSLSDISLSGLVTGTGPDITLLQGQYVVFYDASDTTISSANDAAPSVPSCHLCGSIQDGTGPCDLTGCSSTEATYDGYCWCGNSIYVACGNSGDGNCAYNSQNALISDGAKDGCSICQFEDSDSASSWDITISETSGEPIDSVTYDPATWILTDPGYSYELISKGFDNDLGDNWAQSCSVLGTPGSDPKATCDATCVTGGCGSGGSCNTGSNLCECDTATGYYPQCSSTTSCTKCKLVPGIDDCQVLWTKNGTDRFAVFNWTQGARDNGIMYEVQFFDRSRSGGLTAVGPEYKTPIYSTYFRTPDYYSDNTTYGGFVRSVIEQCWDDAGLNCNYYYSEKIWCEVTTQSPTISPTPAPTDIPTKSPTPLPTQSPTWQCPVYYWKNEEVCDPDRCANCNAGKPPNCCLLDPDFATTYDPNRQHKGTFECKMDVELDKPKKREDGEEAAGSAPGYLLTTGPNPKQHYFDIGIEPDQYPYTMDIFWRLEFDNTDCSYSASGRRRMQSGSSDVECDPNSDDPMRAGLVVTPTSGWLTVHGENDFKNASIIITTQQADCGDIEAYLNGDNEYEETTTTSTTTTPTSRRRLMASGADCLTTVAIYGNLVIVNATSRGQPDCEDGRIYPMRIPVWYNYNRAFTATPIDERELPAWLWWLIAALVIFLALLAFLVYKYWWKNKATGAALKEVQTDLDAAVCEAEDGFGGDLGGGGAGFNPLATGFNPNAPAGGCNPNAPPNGHHGDGDFIRPNVEKPVYRQAYGQQVGNNNNMH